MNNIQTKARRGVAVLMSATALCAMSTPAFAQDAAPAAEEQGGLSEIVVTARKRAESVQDIPVTVSALSAEEIQRKDISSFEKIAASTPNFSVGRSSNGSGAQLTLRGIGSSSTSIGIEQSVAVVVDGVYYGHGRVINEGFFDLERLELLKGPQALFFGKNATAGVVSLTTADPTSEFMVQARAGYEFKAEQILGEVVASGPLSDTLGIRVAVRGTKAYDEYYKNVSPAVPYNTFDIATGNVQNHIAEPTKGGPREREYLGRVTLKWEPTDELTATLKVSGAYNKNVGASYNFGVTACEDGFSTLNPTFACGQKFVTHQNNIPADIAANFPYAGEDGKLYNRYKSFAVTGNVNYELENMTLTSVTNYNWNNNRWACACDHQSSSPNGVDRYTGAPLPGGTWATENSSLDAFSQELRLLTSYDGPVNVMIGAYYQKTKRNFAQWIMFAGLQDSTQSARNRYLATTKVSSTDGETIAGFGQLIWEMSETVEATAGLRYTHETKDSVFAQPYNNAALTGIFRPESDPLGVVRPKQTFNNWSPEATISWKPMDDVMIYGSFKTGYKSGGASISGINSALSNDPLGDLTFNPEKAVGFETGVKSTLLDNQLRLNLGLYTYKYKDLQVDFFNSPIFAFNTLTADARTKGVELDFEYAPMSVSGLSLRGSINYNKARYTSFIGPCYSGQTPAAGCSIVLADGGLRQNLKGKALAVAPEWTGSLGISYDTDFSDTLRGGLAIDARYSDNYLASGFNHPASNVKSYVNLDASVRVGSQDDRWEVALIGKNLTNRFYISGVVDGPSTGSGTGTPGGVIADQTGYGNTPRTVQVQLTVRY